MDQVSALSILRAFKRIIYLVRSLQISEEVISNLLRIYIIDQHQQPSQFIDVRMFICSFVSPSVKLHANKSHSF